MLLNNDVYMIQTAYMIDTIHHRSIQLLYQPLIGFEATSVYLFLWAEVNQITLTKSPCPHMRMTKSLSMSLTSVEESLRKLEAIGLLKTYKKSGEYNSYLYELYTPLSPTDFFGHHILGTLLLKKLGKEDFQRTKVCFQTGAINKDAFTDVTTRFQDVFTIHLDSQVQNGLQVHAMMKDTTNVIEKEYPLELFYAELEQYQIKKDSIDKSDEAIIQQLGLLYHVDVIDMPGLVKAAMVKDRLQLEELSKKCRTYYQLKQPETFKNVHYKQSVQHKSVKNKSTNLNEYITYLENVSPMQLLRAKQGGREPVRKDVVIIESLLTTLQLEPGVINVLIEMTLQQCDHTLPRGYMEHYASQWKRKKITTVASAMQEAKNIMRAKGHAKGRDISPIHEPAMSEETIDDETLRKMLAKYED